eukprot:Rmarinus@m.29891
MCNKKAKQVKRVPTNPPFTLSDIKSAIPAHCFERSTLTSSLYLLRDFVACATMYYIATNFLEKMDIHWSFAIVAWPLYWWIQGTLQTGPWVIGHECGHQAFSSSGLVNDAVGFVVHSFLLVPYFSWKISHGKHHSKTGNVDLDEVFVPYTKSEVDPENISYHSFPLIVLRSIIMLTIGWPAYLIYNAAGRKYDGWANHFMPSSPVFLPKEGKLVLLSNVGLALMLGVLYHFAQEYSLGWVMRIYGMPLLVTNFWLVLYTNLQHTDPMLPHYRGAEWNWLRGALATMDRNYGFYTHLHHNIGDTHVLHHLFSRIPHYHAVEATEAIKPVLGKFYAYSDQPIFDALITSMRECIYVDDEGGVLWYKNSKTAKMS